LSEISGFHSHVTEGVSLEC